MSTPPLTKSRRLGDALHLSGELGFGADGAIPEGITAQTENTIDRIEATLKAEGLTLADVVSATCYLTDKADFAAFNAVYAARFPQPYPTRTTIECGLMIDAKVEITVVAKVR